MTTSTKDSPFFLYYEKLEKKIGESIFDFGMKTKLRDACGYALTNGGKRFRPLIVLFVAEALGHGLDVYPAALAVEFFHTASLIADDLPCMDNDDERREKPSLHKVYGESIALLASYALITAAFEKIRLSGLVEGSGGAKVCMIALESATHCAGILGATSGQFFDLFPPNQTLETVKLVIYQKTVTLFEVAFVFGWIFGGGDLEKLDRIKKAAYHFGMAFQTADDLNDMLQDEKKGNAMSMAQLLGKEGAYAYFHEEMDHLQTILKELNLFTVPFEKMCQILMKFCRN